VRGLLGSIKTGTSLREPRRVEDSTVHRPPRLDQQRQTPWISRSGTRYEHVGPTSLAARFRYHVFNLPEVEKVLLSFPTVFYTGMIGGGETSGARMSVLVLIGAQRTPVILINSPLGATKLSWVSHSLAQQSRYGALRGLNPRRYSQNYGVVRCTPQGLRGSPARFIGTSLE
jgi:hypothetical protein